jgi:hypothetical protein
MGVGVVGVMGSGTVCGEGDLGWGGALDSAVTGCDVVSGGGEASDGSGAKVFSLTGVEGSRMRWSLCLDRCDWSHWQKGRSSRQQQFRPPCLMGEQLHLSWPFHARRCDSRVGVGPVH